MENRSHALIAGLFTIALLVAAIVAGLWFGRDRVERVPIVLVAEGGVGGLLPQANVRFRGMAVGRVSSIGFDQDGSGRILVHADVLPTTPLTAATTARMAQQGVTGLSFIELDDDGSKPGRVVSSAAAPVRLPLRPGPVEEIMRRGLGILSGVQHTLDQVNQLLDDGNRASVRQTLEEVAQAAQALRKTSEQLGPVVAEVAPAIKQLRGTVGQAGDAAREVTVLVGNVNSLVQKMSGPEGPIAQASASLEQIRWAAARLSGDTLPRINDLAGSGTRAAASVERAARALGDSPQSVLFGNAPQPGPGEPGFAGFGNQPAQGAQ